MFLFVHRCVIVIYADIKPNTDSGSAEGGRNVVTLLFIDQALLQCPSFINTYMFFHYVTIYQFCFSGMCIRCFKLIQIFLHFDLLALS